LKAKYKKVNVEVHKLPAEIKSKDELIVVGILMIWPETKDY